MWAESYWFAQVFEKGFRLWKLGEWVHYEHWHLWKTLEIRQLQHIFWQKVPRLKNGTITSRLLERLNASLFQVNLWRFQLVPIIPASLRPNRQALPMEQKDQQIKQKELKSCMPISLSQNPKDFSSIFRCALWRQIPLIQPGRNKGTSRIKTTDFINDGTLGRLVSMGVYLGWARLG